MTDMIVGAALMLLAIKSWPWLDRWLTKRIDHRIKKLLEKKDD